jgi:AraC-like DNA-binding protein
METRLIRRWIISDSNCECHCCANPTSQEGRRERCTCAFRSRKSPIPALLEDDVASVGKWYLGDGVCTPQVVPRTEVHTQWALGLWSLAKTDVVLSGCVSLLTLHKKRELSNIFNNVIYLDQKQRVYRLLQDQLAGRRQCRPSTVALIICLVAFIEVLEGRFHEAKTHIDVVRDVVSMNDLDELPWRLLAWNDLRYAMKLATPPTLPYYFPPAPSLGFEASDSLAIYKDEARRLALGNWKHIPHAFKAVSINGFEVLKAIHLMDLLDSHADLTFQTRITMLYDLEYKLHTLAAAIHESASLLARLFVTALQLHALVLVSPHAPSTPECRQILIQRGCDLAKQIHAEGSGVGDVESRVTVRWSLFILAAYIIGDEEVHGRASITRMISASFGQVGFRSRAFFIRCFRAWPWLERWHHSRACFLWSEIDAGRAKGSQKSVPQGDRKWGCSSSGPYYSGVLTFYDP